MFSLTGSHSKSALQWPETPWFILQDQGQWHNHQVSKKKTKRITGWKYAPFVCVAMVQSKSLSFLWTASSQKHPQHNSNLTITTTHTHKNQHDLVGCKTWSNTVNLSRSPFIFSPLKLLNIMYLYNIPYTSFVGHFWFLAISHRSLTLVN